MLLADDLKKKKMQAGYPHTKNKCGPYFTAYTKLTQNGLKVLMLKLKLFGENGYIYVTVD